jgi:D-alanine-D-alanine ligase
MIVKPVGEGSSKGIYSSSFVKNEKELRDEANKILKDYNQPALAEEFLPGREFTVALLGNGEDTEVLPIVEISYDDFPEDFIPIYSYEAKWILDSRENPLNVFSCPANISAELEHSIKKTVLAAYNIMRCRDWSRIDVRLDRNNIPNIIEINPLPGILPNPDDNSCFPKAARTAGYSYNNMLNKVLYNAAKRYNIL